jgi:2-oxo-4-hydroxy-4-carboxy-5-ureidoimidazoline decarboxylase
VPVEAVSAVGLSRFNALPDAEARSSLLACCASRAWVERVLAQRPYGTVEQLLGVAEDACRSLTQADVDEALSAHPRIGERAEGGSKEAAWSRQEQASVGDADAAVRARIRDANLAYEERFGRVFLVRAAGRTPEQILTEVERRVGNDPDAEQCEVVEQLAQITRLRLEKLLVA